jgi:mannose/fructose/N-acetylgalactosamine-specific phosphotransferase system component IID
MENNEKIEQKSSYEQTIEMIKNNEQNIQDIVKKLADGMSDIDLTFEFFKLIHYNQNNQSLLLGIIVNEIKDIEKFICEKKA